MIHKSANRGQFEEVLKKQPSYQDKLQDKTMMISPKQNDTPIEDHHVNGFIIHNDLFSDKDHYKITDDEFPDKYIKLPPKIRS